VSRNGRVRRPGDQLRPRSLLLLLPVLIPLAIFALVCFLLDDLWRGLKRCLRRFVAETAS
jgi:hypothetical protein